MMASSLILFDLINSEQEVIPFTNRSEQEESMEGFLSKT